MIIALMIHTFCLSLILKDFPFWFKVVLGIVSLACMVIACILWDETTSRIRTLERKLSEKGGAE